MIYEAAAPMDNGGPMSAMSNSAVVGAGSRPVGQGHLVPASAVIKNVVPGGTPTPQQAAMASRTSAAPLPTAQPARAQVSPQAVPITYQQSPQIRPTQNQATGVPRSLPTANDRYGPIAGDGYDGSQFASPGEIKARVYTIGMMITPCQVKSSCLEFRLDDKRSHIIKYKCNGGTDRIGDLSRVICMGIEVIACRNELPITIDFGMTGTRGRDYNWTTGNRSLLSMPPHYSENNGSAPRKLYMHAPTLSMSALRRFSHIKTADLNNGIQPMFDENGHPEDWSMVHISSPVVELILQSYDTLKPTLANVRITENRMPIKNDLIQDIQKFLRAKINECPGSDWRNAAVYFTRSSGNNFNDPDGYPGIDPSERDFDMRQSYSVYAKVIIYYLILSNTQAYQKISARASETDILPTSGVAGAVGGPVTKQNGI